MFAFSGDKWIKTILQRLVLYATRCVSVLFFISFIARGHPTQPITIPDQGKPETSTNPYHQVVMIETSLGSGGLDREKILKAAQDKAIQQFNQQTLSDADLPPPSLHVDEVEIQEEKISPLRYKAKILVRLSATDISQDTQDPNSMAPLPSAPLSIVPEQCLILPLIQEETPIYAHDDSPLSQGLLSMDAWLSSLNVGRPLGDLRDIQFVSQALGRGPITASPSVHDYLASYQKFHLVCLVYHAQEAILEVIVLNGTSTHPMVRQTVSEENLTATLREVLEKLFDPAHSMAHPVGTFESATVSFTFDTLSQWKTVQKQLRHSPWVKDFRVLQMAPGQVMASLRVQQRDQGLKSLFPKASMTGSWPTLTVSLKGAMP